MKSNKQLAGGNEFLKQALQIIQSFGTPLCLFLATLIFGGANASAAVFTWDAGNTNNGATIDSGSGSWNIDTTTNLNWNDGIENTNWIQTSITAPTTGATFNGPDAPDGTYQVSVDGGQVSATNLTINASGYTFSGSPIDLRGSTPVFFIADGKSVIFTNNLQGNNTTSEFRMGINGAPANVVLYGSLFGFQPLFSSTNGSIFWIAGGTGTGNVGTTHVNADVRMTNGVFVSNGAFVVGRQRPGQTQPLNATGVLTVGGTAVFNQNSDYLSLGRDSVWNSTLIVQDSGTLNVQTLVANNNPGIGIPRPGSSAANNQSRMFVYGGTVNMGAPSIAAQPIQLANGGSTAGEFAGLSQTGGVINAWGGIQIGGSGTYNGGSAVVTNSGGFLYLGSVGGAAIRYGAGIPPTNNVSLSGGTVGALQNWISSVPMTLAALNGNITFQCADSIGNPFNISLSGNLTGPGGFYKTGGGVLTLTGTNNYAGITTVSNGTLVVSTANLPKSGDVVLDGSVASSGLPVLSNSVPSAGQSWTMTNLTVTAGTPTIDFQFGTLLPSATVAPIQANGSVTFTATPNFAVDGSAIPTGTYPLIQYTGAYSGPASMSLVYLPPGGISGYVTNIVATKTIALVINSSLNPPVAWGAGNGLWDIATSPNWKKFGAATTYHEGDSVQFDDTASGTSPITVTLNTTVNPGGITAINNTKAYIISGTGAINGAIGLNVTAAGSLTLSNANTYTGGTTVSSPGQLNINYGGSGGADSAIGTGPLTLNTGAKLDNTSGHTVALNTATPIPINWNDDWTFIGSTNFDLGLGQVTLGNVSVILTVVSNTLTVGNQITDVGQNFGLVKQGNGALTLSNANTFAGGFTLNAGTLNINADGALGSGVFAINGGTLDNTSGATVVLGSSALPPASMTLAGSVVFNGTTNLDLGPSTINIVAPTVTLNKNTLITEGNLDGHNTGVMTVNGPGTWDITGAISDNALSIAINGATVLFDKFGGNAVNGGTTTVNTNGILIMGQPTGFQMTAAVTLVLGGGTVDMNGDSENVQTVNFNSGTLKNSAPTTASALPLAQVTLNGSSCVFDVAIADSSLTISNAIGSGGLVKTGAGLLAITTNSYTGNTTISNGTLAISFPFLGANSTVTVNTNATLGTNGVLTLNFANAETNTVAALILGGVSKPAGLYSATTDPLYITGMGSLLVVPLSTINPLPGTIQVSVSGNPPTLALSWPTNAGWILQEQTNLLSNPWIDLAGSDGTTSTNIPISPTNQMMFFRLRHP